MLNGRDVTEHTNLTRVLRTMSAGNRVLVSATDEASLLSGACRTIVEVGGFPLAWVGYAEQDQALTVRPIASAGLSDYLRVARSAGLTTPPAGGQSARPYAPAKPRS